MPRHTTPTAQFRCSLRIIVYEPRRRRRPYSDISEVGGLTCCGLSPPVPISVSVPPTGPAPGVEGGSCGTGAGRWAGAAGAGAAMAAAARLTAASAAAAALDTRMLPEGGTDGRASPEGGSTAAAAGCCWWPSLLAPLAPPTALPVAAGAAAAAAAGAGAGAPTTAAGPPAAAAAAGGPAAARLCCRASSTTWFIRKDAHTSSRPNSRPRVAACQAQVEGWAGFKAWLGVGRDTWWQGRVLRQAPPVQRVPCAYHDTVPMHLAVLSQLTPSGVHKVGLLRCGWGDWTDTAACHRSHTAHTHQVSPR
jgi:hypothetical protein